MHATRHLQPAADSTRCLARRQGTAQASQIAGTGAGAAIYSHVMRQSSILAVIFIIGCAAGGVASQMVIPPVRAATQPTRWEYVCAESRENLTAEVGQFGTQGWELVTVFPIDQDSRANAYGLHASKFGFCFKRPLP